MKSFCIFSPSLFLSYLGSDLLALGKRTVLFLPFSIFISLQLRFSIEAYGIPLPLLGSLKSCPTFSLGKLEELGLLMEEGIFMDEDVIAFLMESYI